MLSTSFRRVPGEVAEILVRLLGDADPDISPQALTTIDEITGDPELDPNEAAHRIRAITEGPMP
jgi:hypothetical protein